MKATAHSRNSRTAVHDVLRQIVRTHFGLDRRIKSWTRRRSAYSSSCQITNLKVELDDGQFHSFLLKSLHPSSWLPTAQRVRPQFLFDSLREIRTYQNILSKIPLGTPRYFYAHVETANQLCWLVTERVQGPPLWQLGQDRHWRAAARWLAHFHQVAEEFSGPDHQAATNLIEYGEEHFLCWAKRAESFLSAQSGTCDADSIRRFARIFDRYDRVTRFLSQLPTTLIHGEFYPSNVLMRRKERGHDVCPIDWELVGRGPGILDLAALSFGGWSPEKKRQIIQAYHDATAAEGSPAMTSRELQEAVDYGQTHLCLRQLGWAPVWQTPEQHSRNWVHDALSIAAKIGLTS